MSAARAWKLRPGRLVQAMVLVSISLPAAAPAAAQSDLIPREALFGNPDRLMPMISPDGRRLAYLAPSDGVLNVWVQTVGADDARPVTHVVRRPVLWYAWAWNNDQIVFMHDTAGEEDHLVFSVDLNTNLQALLSPATGVQARLIATSRHEPDHILLAFNDRTPQLHDVWKVNTRTAERERILENTEGFSSFLADRRLQLRVATRTTPDGGKIAYYREAFAKNGDAAGAWLELGRWSMEDAFASGPIGFADDGTILYLADSRRRNTSALHTFALDGTSYEPVADDPKADLGEVVFDPITGRAQAAAFEQARIDWRVLDEDIRADFAALRDLGVGELSILSRDAADALWTVAFTRDDGPVEFYLYDRRARRATYLFPNRSRLVGLPLAAMRAVTIPARDGLEMVAYLTMPRGREPRKLPMVLLVHGGPWARDRWGFQPVHQWLANRGYAVMSVNFRGSVGFGKAFLNAGNRQWANAMHSDLIDAVNWAVGEGLVDPDRVAIMGGSYGGYAALVGLTFTPTYFACGVDIVGPSHIRTLLETIPPYWGPIRAMFEARVGRLDEPEFLDSISPLTRADQIRRPLLIGQGANDPRVKQSESEQIVVAMQARSLPVTYILFPDEGHGFVRPENRTAFYAVTEVFLAQHLGGRYQHIGEDIATSSAQVKAGGELIPGLAPVELLDP